MMKYANVLFLALLFTFMAPLSLVAADEKSDAKAQEKANKERAEIRKGVQDGLARLYKAQPGARAVVEKAAGYAVFNNFGMKILVAGSGTGKGMAIDNRSKKESFMKMVELQAGLGFGVKKFTLVWVFQTADAFNGFVNSGWELGAQTSAAATTGDKGASMQGAMPISKDIWLYQITDKGLALELTAKGTKYYKDDDLN